MQNKKTFTIFFIALFVSNLHPMSCRMGDVQLYSSNPHTYPPATSTFQPAHSWPKFGPNPRLAHDGRMGVTYGRTPSAIMPISDISNIDRLITLLDKEIFNCLNAMRSSSGKNLLHKLHQLQMLNERVKQIHHALLQQRELFQNICIPPYNDETHCALIASSKATVLNNNAQNIEKIKNLNGRINASLDAVTNLCKQKENWQFKDKFTRRELKQIKVIKSDYKRHIQLKTKYETDLAYAEIRQYNFDLVNIKIHHNNNNFSELLNILELYKTQSHQSPQALENYTNLLHKCSFLLKHDKQGIPIEWTTHNPRYAMYRDACNKGIISQCQLLELTCLEYYTAQTFLQSTSTPINPQSYQQAYADLHLKQNLLVNTIRAEYFPEQAQAFIQQHATVTVDEQRSVVQAPTSSSNNTTTQQSAIDYAQLRDQAKSQHAAIFQKTGKISEQHLSRENALALMAQGDLSVQTKSYTLNAQAQQKLERAGIDTRQFTECTGNLIQQDTHAKLIHAINTLADVRPTTDQGKLISNGTTDCALAGMQLNNEGHVREAMLYSDLCTLVVEKVLHVADNMNPFVLGTRALLDAATNGLHASSAHDLAESLNTLRTNIDEFRTGFVSGALHGATNITNIYEGLCNTVHALGEFAQSAIAFNAEQEALTFALESERYDDARSILAERSARAQQSAAAVEHLTDRITEFIDHMPDMTSQEWRDAGFATGDFAGREAAQLGAIHVGLRGLSRIGQGISNTIQHVETLSRELALSAQLSGNPAAPSIADIVKQWNCTEIVATQNGSRFISGIPATHPEFGSHVLINTVEQFVEGATQVITEGTSAAASQAAAILQLGTQLGNALTDAKPGFIQLPVSSRDMPVAIELHHVLVENKIDISKLDLANLPLHLYDETICSRELLQQLTDQFKNTTGALGKDGPLQKVLEMGYIGANAGCQSTARGALYELEVARELECNGQKIIDLGQKVLVKPYNKRDFDVITETMMIECKNIDWSTRIGDSANKTLAIFSEQKLIAEALGKKFVVYSKQPIPQDWIVKLSNKGIYFIEGNLHA